jgi:hypothetical protein
MDCGRTRPEPRQRRKHSRPPHGRTHCRHVVAWSRPRACADWRVGPTGTATLDPGGVVSFCRMGPPYANSGASCHALTLQKAFANHSNTCPLDLLTRLKCHTLACYQGTVAAKCRRMTPWMRSTKIVEGFAEISSGLRIVYGVSICGTMHANALGGPHSGKTEPCPRAENGRHQRSYLSLPTM